MFRRVLLLALTVLAMGLVVKPGQADSTAAPPKAAARDDAASYSVTFRKQGVDSWTDHDNYTTLKEATDAAEALTRKGYEVQVLPRFALARVPPRPKTGNLSVSQTVTPDEAKDLFQEMKGQGDIAFGYPADGCYARAHLMVQRIQGQGKTAFKIWSFANGESLQVRTARGLVKWRYHVAPVLRVRFNSGSQFWYVIDPSLHQNPVRINVWKSAQMAENAEHEPYLTLTRIGKPPKDPYGHQLPGSGYWTGPDPRVDLDTHATRVMARFKVLESRLRLPSHTR